jgi:hypothetical protein
MIESQQMAFQLRVWECPYVFRYQICVDVQLYDDWSQEAADVCNVKLFRRNMATTKIVPVTLNCEGLFL